VKVALDVYDEEMCVYWNLLGIITVYEKKIHATCDASFASLLLYIWNKQDFLPLPNMWKILTVCRFLGFSSFSEHDYYGELSLYWNAILFCWLEVLVGASMYIARSSLIKFACIWSFPLCRQIGSKLMLCIAAGCLIKQTYNMPTRQEISSN
jgi:hypothetical protein